MFRKGKIFLLGWIYFAVMFVLASVLPPWTGVENGVIENLQLVCLAAGGAFCWRMRGKGTIDWEGYPKTNSNTMETRNIAAENSAGDNMVDLQETKCEPAEDLCGEDANRSLWAAGTVIFFLAFMREISWGRVFFVSEETGEIVKTSELGVYGTLIHVAVGLLIALALFLLYRAKAWRVLAIAKITVSSFILLMLFAATGPVGELMERGKIYVPFVHGQVLEELAELGAYIVAVKLAKETGGALSKRKGKQ